MAFCGKSGHLSKLAPENDWLTPTIVRDFYVTDDGCEEGKRCFVFDCPLNHATVASLAAEYALKKPLEAAPSLGRISLPPNLSNHINQPGRLYYENKNGRPRPCLSIEMGEA